MFLALLLTVLAPGSGLAHTTLVSSDPADGAVLRRPPQRVVLTFTQAPLAAGMALRATGPAGSFGLKPELNGTRVVADWPGTENSGQYRVSFRVVAEDGHPIEGSFAFRLTGPKQQSSLPPTQAAAPAAEADDGGSSPSSLPAWLWVAGAVVLALAILLIMRMGRADRE